MCLQLHRRSLGPVASLGLVVLGACASPIEERAQDVILITVDTLRADALGFAGNTRVETPTLDRLAAGGRVFENAHAHSTVTLPSHANILTGLYPFRHGVRDNLGFRLADDHQTLAETLRENGFATAAFITAVPLIAETGLDQGFDEYDDRLPAGNPDNPFLMAQRSGDEVVSKALDWWYEKRDSRRFLWVHLFEPHAPYQPAGVFAEQYEKKPYLGEVATADAYLAPLIDSVLTDPEGHRSLIVFTSDHGESLGEHGETTHGFFAYESTLKIPLVLWGAGVVPGRDERAARHVDLVSTILDATGIRGGGETDGQSLLAEPEGVAAPASYFESLTANLTRGWAPLRGQINDRHKVIDLPIPELYDLTQDPAEEQNLAPARAAEVRSQILTLPDRSTLEVDRGVVPIGVEQQLEALGYLGGRAPAKSSYGVEDDLKNLVSLDRKLMRTHMLYTRGEYDQAAAMAAALLAERADLVKAQEYLAFSLLHLGRREESVAVMRDALGSGSAQVALVNQLALTLIRMGAGGEAVAILEDAMRDRETPAVSTLNALTLALIGSDRAEEAVQVVERILDQEPDNAAAHENLALAYQALGRWEEARDAGLRATELDDQRADSWSNLGVAFVNLRDSQSAIDSWTRALELAPNHLDALFNLGLTCADTGQADRARQALARFLELSPPTGYGPQVQVARETLAQLAR